jgi:hypothetical protein
MKSHPLPPVVHHSDHRGTHLLGVVLLALVFIGGCIVIPLPSPTSTSKPEAILVNATRTDREVTTLLPKEIALEYLRSNPSDNRCVIFEEGLEWFGGQTYEFRKLKVVESQVKTRREYFIWLFLDKRPHPGELLCTWNQLASQQSVKLLTVLVSLGVQYR